MNLKPCASPPKAVIFDCDGTLVDSETSGITAIHEEARKLGYAMPLSYALNNFRGKRMAVCFTMIEEALGHAVPPDFEAIVRRAMAIRFQADVMAMPGAAALLQQLGQAAIPYCIASNGPQAKMVLTLELSGLTSYFTKHVFSAYDIGSWKPEPELFLHAAREMQMAPSDCAVVEDSLTGIAAGLAAGMQVYSMCDAATIAPEIAAQVVQITGLSCLAKAWRLVDR